MLTTRIITGTYRPGTAKDEQWQQIDGYCLSTDVKPTEHILNGSSLIEMDTGKVYFFDETAGAWLEFGG